MTFTRTARGVRLVAAPRVALLASLGPNETRPGWEASLCLWLRGPVLSVGWGWDDEEPVRPWPVFNRKSYRGVPRVSLSLLGFFVMLAWLPTRTKARASNPDRAQLHALSLDAPAQAHAARLEREQTDRASRAADHWAD